jgi:hypothetical protein
MSFTVSIDKRPTSPTLIFANGDRQSHLKALEGMWEASSLTQVASRSQVALDRLRWSESSEPSVEREHYSPILVLFYIQFYLFLR